jgi:hypothetical protein
MARKALPQYRDVTSFGRVYIWLDERDGASALVCQGDGELAHADLQRIFRIARNNEIQITSKRPLLVHAAYCLTGESDTWRLVQLAPKELTVLEREVRYG